VSRASLNDCEGILNLSVKCPHCTKTFKNPNGVVRHISAGKGGKVDALVIPETDAEDQLALAYLQGRVAANSDPNRQRYSFWGGHNCGTLSCETLSANHRMNFSHWSLAGVTPLSIFYGLVGTTQGPLFEFDPKLNPHSTYKLLPNPVPVLP
jgi:hypothetical protein